MTANARPNLGGLFTGVTPPDRSSSIADALGPRAAAAGPGNGATPGNDAVTGKGSGRSTRSAGTAGLAARQSVRPKPAETPAPLPLIAGTTRSGVSSASDRDDHWAALQWLDPVRALGSYFDFMQGVLDAQRRVTISLASIVSAPVRRIGLWR